MIPRLVDRRLLSPSLRVVRPTSSSRDVLYFTCRTSVLTASTFAITMITTDRWSRRDVGQLILILRGSCCSHTPLVCRWQCCIQKFQTIADGSSQNPEVSKTSNSCSRRCQSEVSTLLKIFLPPRNLFEVHVCFPLIFLMYPGLVSKTSSV